MKRKVLKKKYRTLCKMLLGGVAIFGGMFANQHTAQAMPVINSDDVRNNVNYDEIARTVTGTKENGFISWKDFSINKDELLTFSGMTNMLNYVDASLFKNPSLIYGSIDASAVPGNFYIVNPNGVLFGPNSSVLANDFYISTRSLSSNDINNYIENGNKANYKLFSGTANINENGLKSSDIMGAYDIADGDVMFLGQVQANSLTIEGNTIQIRNTKDIKNKAGTEILEGDKVNLISDNHPEVGYEVTQIDSSKTDEFTLQDPFNFTSTTSEIDFISKVAKYYNIYLFREADGTIKSKPADDEDAVYLAFKDNYDCSEANYKALENLYTFYKTKIDSASTTEDKVFVSLALDALIRDKLVEDNVPMTFFTQDKELKLISSENEDVNTLDLSSEPTNSDYSSALADVKVQYNDLYGNNFDDKYKYFVADALGDENMLNSANNLGWKATQLNGSTQTIDDYRLVTSAEDLQNINFSSWTKETQLNPAEGYIHGNYMLYDDVDLMDLGRFKPLGYKMDFTDFKSTDDMLNFNGLNFTISNLNANWSGNDTIRNAGLFSVFSGTIKNLRLQDFSVSGDNSAGALVGLIGHYGSRVQSGNGQGDWDSASESYKFNTAEWLDKDSNNNLLINKLHFNSTIKNVSLTGNRNVIESQYYGGYSGGLVGSVGYNEGKAYEFADVGIYYWDNETYEEETYTLTIPYSRYQTWRNSYYPLTIDGKEYYLNNNDYTVYVVPGFPQVKFENVENFSEGNSYIQSESSAGGIVGIARGDISIQNSINKSNVQASGYDSGSGGLLGITGTYEYDEDSEVTGNYNSFTFDRVANLGDISSNYNAGGILGYVTSLNSPSSLTVKISKSWNEGTIKSDSYNSNAGGIIGNTLNFKSIEVDQVFNSGTIDGNYRGGIFGYLNGYDANVNLTNAYNTGKIQSSSGSSNGAGGGIAGGFSVPNGEISNVYNAGEISGEGNTGGLIGSLSNGTLKNSYNLGNVTGSKNVGGIVGYWYNSTISNVFNTGDVSGDSDSSKVGGLVGNSSNTITNSYNLGKVNGVTEDTSTENTSIYNDVFSTWDISEDGKDSSAMWRRYEDPDDKYNFERQPLLTAFLNDAVIQRYNELDEAGKVTVADLVTIENPNMNILHNSSGEITDVRYRNNGKSSVYSKGSTRYYDAVDADLVKYDIVSSSDKKNFAVDDTTSFASARIWSSQFGYNFKADKDENDTWKTYSNEDVKAAGTNPDDNTIYLMLGETNNIPDPTPPVDIGKKPVVITKKAYSINIYVLDGTYDSLTESYTFYTFNDSIDNSTPNYETYYTDDEVNLDNFKITGEVIEIDDEKKTSVKIKYGNNSYTVENGGLTYNDDNDSYSVRVKLSDTVYYDFNVYTGNIKTIKVNSVKIKAVNAKMENGELVFDSDNDFDITGEGADFIKELLEEVDFLEVQANTNGKKTELNYKNKDKAEITEYENSTEYKFYGTFIDSFGDEDTKCYLTISEYPQEDGSIIYEITDSRGEWWDKKSYNFTKTTDGTFTYEVDDYTTTTTYNITVLPGKIISGTQIPVTIEVANGKLIDGDFTGNSYNVDNTDIKTLLQNTLEVFNDNGKTNVRFKDEIVTQKTTNVDDGTITYNVIKDDTPYIFTKNTDGTFTYEVENNGDTTTYEVSIEKGDVEKIYNIGIQVSDGVYYINEQGEGTLSLDLMDGYKITNDPDNSNFTDNFSVKYNDPADITQITGPATTTVSVTNKTTNENYNTGDVSLSTGVYNSLTKNDDGSYTIQAVKDNVTYNINIKPGLVVSDTRVPVTINVADGKVTDGVFTNNGYTVTNNDILKLLDGKLEVANVDGKTTVKFKDEVKNNLTDNGDGTFTYNDGTNKYDFTKNSDGTFTYNVKNTNGEILTYKVAIDTGDITTENNTDVKITVKNGTVDNGDFTSNGYTVNNTFIEGLLNGNLKVIKADDKTTVTVNNASNLTKTGDTLTYTAANGTPYTFTKTGDNQYTYTVINGDTTTNYHVQIIPGNINSTSDVPVTINVADGKISNGELTVVSSDKDYTIDNKNIASLLTGVLAIDKNSDGTATTLKFTDGVTVTGTTPNSDGSTTYNVTKSGKAYTFTKNLNGSYTYTDNSNPLNVVNYIVTVDPGTLTYDVQVKVSDMTLADDEVISGGGYTVSSDNNGFIADLLSGKVNVIETTDGLNTTLQATNPSALTRSGNNYTYKATDGKTYNFTKSGDVYKYTADNGAIYEVTLEQGDVNKNYNIGIRVSDGVFYINEKGDGTLSLDTDEGYTIEQSVGKDKFTKDFNVKYNDPADVTQITGPATTTVSVTNKNTGNNYKTSDVSLSTGIYNSLTKNDDGSYTISAVNGNITYNINIKPGLVVSDTTIPVTINVKDGKLTDDQFTNDGYTVTNNDIKTLLDGKLEVVNVDGKTTVKFKDEVKNNLTDNGNGSYTYNDGTNKYDFTKNSDGTFTYEVQNSNGETLTYKVAIDTGDIAIENNTDVVVTVRDGNLTDGTNFKGNGYDVDNDFIKGLLNGNLQVIKANDKTTVTVNNADNLDRNGNNLTYTAANGTKYDFTKTGDNQYSYTVTNGNTTTNYHVTVIPGNINSTDHIPVTISVADGKISNGALTVVSDGGKNYTIDNENISTLLTDVLKVKPNSDGTGTTLEFTDGVTVTNKTTNSNGSTTYNVTKNGTPYTFTKNSDGTFTYTDNSDKSNVLVYNVTVDPGTLTYGVTVKAGDMTKTDNVVTSNGGYTVTNDNTITNSKGVIAELLSGKLEVVETDGGQHTTLVAKDINALTVNGDNYTYKAGGKVYNFTKSGDVYTYKADNGVTYEVTLEKGNLEKIYNIGIQVSDGVYYINEKGDGTLSLDLVDGYKITNDPDNSNFTDNFSVKYNDPADVTQITGPATTTVSVTNKTTGNNYNTGDVSLSTGIYNSLTKNDDGSYTVSAIKDNITYNINIKTGLVVSDTTIPVNINVADGKVIDNKFTGDGYDVTNNDIKTLLQDALEVVNVDGKTTVKLKDEIPAQTTTNADGSVTYNVTKGDTPYTFTKNSDGTFTYSVMNPNGEEINYHVTINNGDVFNENNKNVLVTVNNGTMTDGQFKGNGYDVDNDFIKGLLNGNLQVVNTGDKTTVKVRNDSNLVKDGNSYTYTTNNGTPYTFTKTGDNQYSYTVTSGKTTTHYNVQIVPGNITTTNHVPVTINVADGKISNGNELTIISDGGKNYTIDNKNIATLLTDVLTVDKNSDGTATTLKFTDDVKVVRLIRNSNGSTTYNVTKNGTPYTFTKNSDGTFTYTDNSDKSNVLVYNVTVDPGTLTYGVTVKAGDITQTDNVITSNGGYTVTNDNTITNSNGVIAELLNGKLEVVPTADGLNTTLAATDKNSLTRSGNNYTYTSTDGKVYNFTKSGDVYTYTADNGVTYEVTLEKGNLEKIYNIGIQVSDGVFYINEKGEGTLSLDVANGYTVTNDPDNSNFAGNFNISYNEPLKTPGDTTQVTGPYKTTVTVTNKNGNSYNTNDFNIISGGYNNINANKDDSYSISAVKDNVTYNINIKPGSIVSDTKIPVTINVKDGKVVDDKFTGNGYDVTNNDIKTLLDGKLEVVNVDGKTTVKFKDDVSNFIKSNGDGTYTYDDGTNKYTYNKNTDGTFTYSVTNPNGEEIDYVVKIDTGNIATTNNVPVTINVKDGKVVDDKFTGNGYDVTNDDIKTLLDGKLEVVNVDGKTTVKFKDDVSDSITNNGDGTYTYNDGTNKYTYNKNTDGTFTYSVTNPSGETINYNVTVDPGNITTTDNIPVTINVKDGKIVDDKFTGNGYDVTNDDIKTLLDGKLEVVNVDGKTTVKFKDDVSDFITNNGDGTYTYNDGTNKYTYNKNTDGTFTYSVTNPSGETINYNVTVDPGNITTTNNVPVTISVGDGTITDGKFSGSTYDINDPTSKLKNLLGELTVTPTSDGNHTTINLPTGELLVLNDDGTYTYTYTGDDGTITKYIITIDPGDISKYRNENVTIDVGNGKNDNGTFTSDGYTIPNDTIRNLLDGVITVTTTDNATTKLDFVDKSEGVFTDNGDGTFIYNKGGVNYPFAKTGDNKYTFSITGDDGLTTNYTITIQPGTVTNYLDKDVSLKVGDGTLNDGEFTGNGYNVDNDLIGGLLSGELNVKYNRYKMTTDVEFANPDNLTTDGTNYSYTKDGVTYNFTKNSDGTFNYVVTNGNTTTTYKVAIDPGALTINNTPRETSTPSSNPTPSTPSTPSTPTNTSTPSNNNSSSSGGGGSSSTPTTPTNSVPTPVYTTSTPAQDTTTPSTNEPNNDISITSTPEVTISTPEPNTTTQIPEPEPTPVEITTPEPTPLDEIISTPEPTVTTPTDEISTPESAPTDETISEPELTPTDEIISEPEPLPLDETVTNTETVDELELDDAEYNLRSSQIEEFPEEKGDYIDLDSQDHILIETLNANESIFDIDVMPEEFNKAADRNIVNDNSNSISNSPTADTGNNANINTNTSSGNGGGLTSINTTPSNNTSSNAPSSTTTSTGGNRNSGLNSISTTSNSTSNRNSNSTSNRNSNSRTTTSTENSNGNSTVENGAPASNVAENQGDNSSTSDNDSSSTAVNLDGDLGAIESGRSDASQEVSQDGNGQGTGTQELSADTQNTQDTNSTSDNSTSQDSNSNSDNSNSQDSNSDNENDDENDRDNESEEE